MAPDPIVQERVYQAMKADIRAGFLRPGARVKIQSLSDRYGSSVTPVREACWRLVGEMLLEAQAPGGFRMRALDAARLRHLYEWNAQILVVALASLEPGVLLERLAVSVVPGEAFTGREIAGITGELFQAIAGAARNPELEAGLDRLNDRLSAARLAEGRVIRELQQELTTLLILSASGVRNVLRKGIVRYHSRRIERAGEIVDAMIPLKPGT
jgi:DNA-binding GntR family transcriptional regulator